MNRRILALSLALFVVALAASAQAQNLGTSGLSEVREEPISLQVDQERIINMAVTRVTVANPSVVKATPLTDQSAVLLTALSSGKTEIRFFPADEPNVVRVLEVTVKRRNLADLKTEIEALLSYMIGVQVEQAAENLVLKGEVLESTDRARLDKIIELYPELIDFTTNKFQQVEEDRLRDLILADLENEKLMTIRVEIKNVRGEFKALLRGVAYTDEARARAEEVAKLYYDNVINLIQLEKPVIEMDVIIATLDMNRVKQLGRNNVFGAATAFSITGYLNSNFGRDSFFEQDADNRGQVAGGQRPDEPAVSVAPTISIAPGGVASSIRALRNTSAAVFYSEQHQAVLSGETASFRDGGTIFVPTVTNNTTGVEEVTFGFQVDITPEQKEDGLIKNTIEVNNSTPVQIDAAQGSIALDEYLTSSVVECRSDETIVLSGIDTNQLVSSEEKTPFLNRIPLLNLFFRARDKQGTESRSLILITPTSASIWRESRQPFSTDAARLRTFIKDESPYWERDIDWGYYSEFYEKPGNTVPFLNTYDTYLWYDESAPSEGMEPTSSASMEYEEAPMDAEPMMEEAAPAADAPADAPAETIGE